MNARKCAAVLSLIIIATASPTTPAGEPTTKPTPFAERLYAGEIDAAVRELAERVKKGEDPDQASFELGFCQFLRAFEKLGQDLHRFGFMGRRNRMIEEVLPFAKIKSLANDKPEPLSYERARQIIDDWGDGLMAAESALSKVRESDVKIPIQIGKIRMDFDGDGKALPEESFWQLFNSLSGRELTIEDVEQFTITFDRADVEWLRGYCHLLATFADVALAYDWQELFDAAGPIFFPKAHGAGKSLADVPPLPNSGWFSESDIADGIAIIHLMHFKLIDKDRMQSALKHLESTIEQSRLMWQLVRKEKDDDHEWIPSPKQSAAIPGMSISEAQILAWHGFLSETENVLKGKKLIPHWRYRNNYDGDGVNLRKVFTSPQDFDLVLWAHGSGMTSFIEMGDVIDQATFRQMEQVFEGNFMMFALWVN